MFTKIGGSGVEGGPPAPIYNGVIDQSCMFNNPSTTHLAVTSTDDSNVTCTHSVWIKRSAITGNGQTIFSMREDDDDEGRFGFGSGDEFFLARKNSGSTTVQYLSTAFFRDCSGWYHVVVVGDCSNGTATERIRVYINNVRITEWETENTPSLNESAFLCRSASRIRNIGRRRNGTEKYIYGYMAEYNYIDGSALEPTDFGELKEGIWVPKTYAGAYPNNSHLLTFADSSHFGDDTSGNANDWNDNGFGTDHQVIDTPENNYCTYDPNLRQISAAGLTEGGLQWQNTASSWRTVAATFLLKTGKWYWEVDHVSDSNFLVAGILAAGENGGLIRITNEKLGDTATQYGLESRADKGPTARTNNSDSSIGSGGASNGSIIMIAFDADANKLWFGRDNAWYQSGDPENGTNAIFDGTDGINTDLFDYVPALTAYQQSVNKSDFGQSGYQYTPPAGFNTLCTANLPEPSMIEPTAEAFNVVLYEGTGAEHAITGVGFQPDLVWLKNRETTDWMNLVDSVRGVTKEINCTSSSIQSTVAEGLKSFDADGFTLGDDDTYNTNGENYVAWCFKKGAQYGFDIQTYVGTDIPHAEDHDLGVTPKLIICKNLGDVNSQDRNWIVFHYAARNKNDPETDYGELDTSQIWTDEVVLWNDVAPTSTQFTVGTSHSTNQADDTHIAYLFADIAGYSKVFHYEGNGSASGPYINCGFRPRWILFKNSDNDDYDWKVIDSLRDPINPLGNVLQPSIADAEIVSARIDFCANGFKLIASTGAYNNNGNTLVGVAFAEQPFKYANAR